MFWCFVCVGVLVCVGDCVLVLCRCFRFLLVFDVGVAVFECRCLVCVGVCSCFCRCSCWCRSLCPRCLCLSSCFVVCVGV